MNDSITVGRNAASMVEAPSEPVYTGVKIYVGKDDEGADLYFFAGKEGGSVLEIDNPWGTQVQANNILSAISSYAYRPMEAQQALLTPAAELGDAVTVNKVYTVLAKNDTTYGSLLVSDIGAPASGELGHEYPYIEKGDRSIQRQISQAAASLNVEIDAIKAQVTDDDGNYTVMTLKSDGLYVGGTAAKLDGHFIGNETIGSAQLADGSVGTDQLANLGITGTKIANGAISTDQLATNAVTAGKILAGSIRTGHISSGAVDTDQLASKAITAEKIDTGAITASKISAEAVTTNKLLLTGMIDVYNSSSKSSSASFGYGTGYDGKKTTYGAKLESSSGGNYVIVTNAGARMTAGGNYIYATSSGCFCSSEMTVTSDERAKEDIDDDMTAYKDVLMHLRPVSFKYKPEFSPSTQRHTGVIAQEAERVMAEYGVENWSLAKIGGEDVHCISYEALVPVLVSCVQDMAKEIAELKERLNG